MNGDFPEFNGELPEGFDPSSGQMPPMNGELPKGFDPSQMPNFSGGFPASPPNEVNFGNGTMPPMNGNQTA